MNVRSGDDDIDDVFLWIWFLNFVGLYICCSDICYYSCTLELLGHMRCLLGPISSKSNVLLFHELFSRLTEVCATIFYFSGPIFDSLLTVSLLVENLSWDLSKNKWKINYGKGYFIFCLEFLLSTSIVCLVWGILDAMTEELNISK